MYLYTQKSATTTTTNRMFYLQGSEISELETYGGPVCLLLASHIKEPLVVI